jgi:hypothetical protein
MFAAHDSATAPGALQWIQLELDATLAGGVASKCKTLILSRGKVHPTVVSLQKGSRNKCSFNPGG